MDWKRSNRTKEEVMGDGRRTVCLALLSMR